MKTIEYNKFHQFYTENTQDANDLIAEVLQSGKYIKDKQIEILEKSLGSLCYRKFVQTTASCTDALYFSLKTAGIKEGDEVILPSFSYIASLSPILMCGAIPVFADINPETLVLDIDIVENLITEKTKAIIFVQLFGNITNLEKLQKICQDAKIVLVEDAAQGLGSSYGNLKGASQGDLSCISFDPTKIVSAYGTGGAVLTNNISYYSKLKMLIHHGRNEQGEFEILGYNSKIPELNAALINLQLKHISNTTTENNSIAEKYISKLNHIPEIKFVHKLANSVSTYHKFVIMANQRNELKKYLIQNGIETRIHYSPLLHEQKLLNNYKYQANDLSVSKQIKQKVISLPIYPGLNNAEIDYICNCILKFYKL